MKKSLFVILAISFVLFFNQPQASAIVTADGWMNWNLPSGATFGIGIVSARESQRNVNNYISNLFEYDNVAPFSVSLTDGYSNVSTNIDPLTHKISGQVSALSMNQGDMNYWGEAGSAGGQYIYYTGVLSNLDYSYFFHGQNDSLRDQLRFTVQIDARYGYTNSAGQWVENDVYSDYLGGGIPIPNAYYVTNNTNEVQYSGIFHRDLSSYGEQTWFISYDFYIGGSDTVDSNSNNPVPEPATMLLLGSGLIGLAGYGRKKFFKK